MKRAFFSNQNPFGIGKHALDKFVANNRISESKSCNLLLQSGLIVPSSGGVFHLMPMMLRSVEKLTKVIDEKMRDIGAQKLMLSHLGEKQIWQQTGRWESFGKELVKTKLSGTEYCLCPTHEESICKVMLNYNKQLSSNHCPMRLYQTTHKFRDEPRPQHGLLRCREFLMNDLYTFDADVESSRKTYNQVTDMYDELFNHLGIDVLKVQASTGVIGGDSSHEYHILSDIGQDTVCIKQDTGEAFSEEYIGEKDIEDKSFTFAQAIEVGHTFLLGTRYSKQLNVRLAANDNKFSLFEMGCYGLGVTRIIAACLEVMSVEEGMRWPFLLAPYKVCITLPKDGSKEINAGMQIAETLYDDLNLKPMFNNDIVVYDDGNRTIGWKLAHANLIGYPVVIVVGKHVMDDDPKVEITFQGSNSSNNLVPVETAVEYICNNIQSVFKYH